MSLFRLTLKSTNGKTGPIPVSTTSRDSCPACPLAGNGGCYAEQQPLRGRWDELSAGKFALSLAEFCDKISALPIGQLWRHNQAGDLPRQKKQPKRIDARSLAKIVTANLGRRGFTYTHHDVDYADNAAVISEANHRGFTVNLSANNLAHADRLTAKHIAPVTVLLPAEYGRKTAKGEWAETLEQYRERTKPLPRATPAGNRFEPCPATYLDTNCDDCQLCAKQERKVIVGFPGHGAGKAKVTAIATA